MSTATVEIDSRGRLSLGKLTKTGGTYRATTRDDGSILLEPAKVLTEAEIAVMRSQQVMDDLQTIADGTAEEAPFDWKS